MRAMKTLQLLLLGLLLGLSTACTPRGGSSGDDDDDSAGDDDDSAGDDDDATGDDDDATGDDDDATGDDDDTTAGGSAGCGLPATHSAGGVQVQIDAGDDGAGTRGFYLSIPSNYDPNTPHKLIVGYSGTNWVGSQVRGYLALEDGQASDEIFVYPDPLWWSFPGWGELGGWLLGPHAYPANGNQDLVLTEVILDYLESTYCIDVDRVFATGHSWGGDMAAVVGCFLGDRFTASAPAAANRPYWFEPSGGSFEGCAGDAAIWTWFGQNDTHFTQQSYPGEYGDEQVAFWIGEKSCDGFKDNTTLSTGGTSECVEYAGCASVNRYCLYGPDTGHQIPSYFSAETIAWFRSF